MDKLGLLRVFQTSDQKKPRLSLRSFSSLPKGMKKKVLHRDFQSYILLKKGKKRLHKKAKPSF